MHDVMRNRILRKLEALPPERLYQVLDYIDFLESRYAAGVAPEPAGLQRFAERLEDRMRARTVAPRVIGGAMSAIGAAGRLVNGVAGMGRDLAAEWESAAGASEARRRGRSRLDGAAGKLAQDARVGADAGVGRDAGVGPDSRVGQDQEPRRDIPVE